MLAGIALASGCANVGRADPERAFRAHDTKIVVIDQGTQSAIAKQRFEVIQNPAAFTALWKEHSADEVPAPPVPIVDFSERMVLAVFAGQRSSGGYDIAVDRFEETPTKMNVVVRLTVPGRGCMVSSVLTSPYQFVTTPLSPTQVTFKVEKVSRPCE